MKQNQAATEAPWSLVNFALNRLSASAYLLDRDGRISYANDEAERTSGYSRKDLIDMMITDLVLDLSVSAWERYWDEVRVAGTGSFMLPLKRKDGGAILTDFSMYYFTGTQGSYVLALQKTRHKSIAEVNTQPLDHGFRALLESTSDYVARFDRECRYVYVNRTFESYFDTFQAQLLGKQPVDVWPDSSCRIYQARLEAAMETGQKDEYELFIENPRIPQEHAYHRVRLMPEFDADNRVSGLLCIGRDISGFENAERQLRTVANHFPDMVARFDHECRYTYVNPTLLATLKLPAKHFLGRTVTEAYPLDTKVGQKLINKVKHVFETGKPNECEAHVNLGARPCCFDFRFIPESNGGGTVMSVLSIARDITERKQAQDHLALIDFALDNVREAAYLVNEDAGFDYVNAEACRMLGYSRDELLGMTVPDIDPAYPLERFREDWREFMKVKSRTIETSQLAKDGHFISVEVSSNYFEYKGRPYKLALCRDISERKRIEEALKETSADLVEAQKIAGLGSWRFDLPSHALRWSNELYRLFDADPKTVAGSYDSFLQRVHPEDRSRVENIFEEAQTQGTAFAIEYRIIFTNDSTKTIRVQGYARRDHHGTVIELFGTAQDVTDRRAAEQARLDEALAQRQLLVREVHHRIKNHLQGLVGLLGRFEFKHPEIAYAFQEAANQIQVIATIHGLQAQTGAEQPPLIAVIQAIVDSMQQLTEVTIELSQSKAVSRITVTQKSSVPIALILNELVLNAIKHGKFSAEHKKVQIALSSEHDTFVIQIINPGRITPLPTDAPAAQAGTGLGLARLLLPTPGARLGIESHDGCVVASLRLSPPVLVSLDKTR